MTEYTHSFKDYRDAVAWLEKALDELPPDHEIFNAGVNYIAGKWRVGLSTGSRSLVQRS